MASGAWSPGAAQNNLVPLVNAHYGHPLKGSLGAGVAWGTMETSVFEGWFAEGEIGRYGERIHLGSYINAAGMGSQRLNLSLMRMRREAWLFQEKAWYLGVEAGYWVMLGSVRGGLYFQVVPLEPVFGFSLRAGLGMF